MELYHVSFESVPYLLPRVPRHVVKGEDQLIPRICFAESIEKCINAKASGAQTVLNALQYNVPLALYIYSIDTEYYTAEELLPPLSVFDTLRCADALVNCEYALLRMPVFTRVKRVVVHSAKAKDGRIREIMCEPSDSGNSYFLEKCIAMLSDKVGKKIYVEDVMFNLPGAMQKAYIQYVENNNCF